MPMSEALLSEGQRPWASNKGLRPCPLHTEIPVSLNLLMMLVYKFLQNKLR